ncbi:MAG: universal stress protein [Acidimicrobiales bacterium]
MDVTKRMAPARAESDSTERVVVVGVDGSKASSEALVWAAEEARLRGATLRVVHAWSLPMLNSAEYVPAEVIEEAPAAAEESLAAQVTDVLGSSPEIGMEHEVRQGPPARVILEAARDAELVVVGSRGRGGFSGLLLGSVSAQVAHHAACPVTIVRQARQVPGRE